MIASRLGRFAATVARHAVPLGVFFGFFAVLKVTLESWRTLARMFGWRAATAR